jgi:chromosome partitioning protein
MVGTEKGGVGKSTFTQNLASIRSGQGRRVAVFDLDGQNSTFKWAADRREAGGLPEVHVKRIAKGKKLDEDEFAEELGELTEEYEDVFIDVGGQDSDVFRWGLAVADHVVVPLIPSPADLNTVPDLFDLVGTYTKKIPIQIVLNQADKRKLMTQAMIAQIEPFEHRLPRMKMLVAARESYKFAMAQGRGVAELTGRYWDAAAANEMKDLYLGVFSL